MKMSYQYIKPTEEQIKVMQYFRDRFTVLTEEIDGLVKDSRGKSLCKTKLEEASFWLNKSITHNDE